MNIAYTCFCTDVIHEGHLNIIKEARKYGRVIVGVLSDEAVIKYNRFFTLNQDDRAALIRKIDGVDEVVIQEDYHYSDVIAKYHPDYIIHGDNW